MGEAVRHAVYVLNRLPTKALTDCTPYEAWSGTKPNVDHIRISGCVAHMKVLKPHLRKLDDRSRKVIYLGIEPGTKAHRLCDPETEKLHVSRDVKFEENISWSWSDEGGNKTDQFTSSFTVHSFGYSNPNHETQPPIKPPGTFTPYRRI